MEHPVPTDSKKSPFFGNYSPLLFWPAAIIYIFIIAFAIEDPEFMEKSLLTIRGAILRNMNWMIMVTIIAASCTCLWLAFSRFSQVKLGGDDAEPEFSFYSWVAMLFCTGLGTGFVIFGSAEPIIHLFSATSIIDAGNAGKSTGVPEAIRLSVMNWGLLGFPLFSIGGWAIGYAAYRHNKPFRTSTGLYGILGERCNDMLISKIVDILAIIATIGGVSMMIGLSVASIAFASKILFGVDLGAVERIILMMLLIVAYIISSSTGLARGIRILSESTGYLAFLLLLAVLFISPTPLNYIMSILVEVTGEFIWRIPQSLFWLDAGHIPPRAWVGDWPIFFVLWNASYIAFTGGVVARISKGRTLRQFILGVCIVPIILCIIWFSVWGANAAYIQLKGPIDVYAFVQNNPEQALYMVLDVFPMGGFLCLVAFVCFILFSVTTADSASFFLAQQTTEGHEKPALFNCVFWGVLIGVTGILFQLIGGFEAIRALAIVAASPFIFVAFAYIISIIRMLQKDYPLIK